MPRWVKLVSECLPLTHFGRIASDVMLQGSNVYAVGYYSAALGFAMITAMTAETRLMCLVC
jgi:hypothetical protein